MGRKCYYLLTIKVNNKKRIVPAASNWVQKDYVYIPIEILDKNEKKFQQYLKNFTVPNDWDRFFIWEKMAIYSNVGKLWRDYYDYQEGEITTTDFREMNYVDKRTTEINDLFLDEESDNGMVDNELNRSVSEYSGERLIDESDNGMAENELDRFGSEYAGEQIIHSSQNRRYSKTSNTTTPIGGSSTSKFLSPHHEIGRTNEFELIVKQQLEILVRNSERTANAVEQLLSLMGNKRLETTKIPFEFPIKSPAEYEEFERRLQHEKFAEDCIRYLASFESSNLPHFIRMTLNFLFSREFSLKCSLTNKNSKEGKVYLDGKKTFEIIICSAASSRYNINRKVKMDLFRSCENERIDCENERIDCENERIDYESERIDCENERTGSENERVDCENETAPMTDTKDEDCGDLANQRENKIVIEELTRINICRFINENFLSDTVGDSLISLVIRPIFPNFPKSIKTVMKNKRDVNEESVVNEKKIYIPVIKLYNGELNELAISFDGVPLNKNNSVWIASYKILEKQTDNWSPIRISTIIKGKPTDNDLLESLVKEIESDEDLKVKYVTADSPARALITKSVFHSGYNACPYCNCKGKYYRRVTFPQKGIPRSQIQLTKTRSEPTHQEKKKLLKIYFEKMSLKLTTVPIRQ
ncbi:hypothetical protein SNEBB_003230 [Seison nebaliae]|nr:hypothetical protein SNEBB_003230 [Seison nebaliae]